MSQLPVDIFAEIFKYLFSAAFNEIKDVLSGGVKYPRKFLIVIRQTAKIYLIPLLSTCSAALTAFNLFRKGGRYYPFIKSFDNLIVKNYNLILTDEFETTDSNLQYDYYRFEKHENSNIIADTIFIIPSKYIFKENNAFMNRVADIRIFHYTRKNKYINDYILILINKIWLKIIYNKNDIYYIELISLKKDTYSRIETSFLFKKSFFWVALDNYASNLDILNSHKNIAKILISENLRKRNLINFRSRTYDNEINIENDILERLLRPKIES